MLMPKGMPDQRLIKSAEDETRMLQKAYLLEFGKEQLIKDLQAASKDGDMLRVDGLVREYKSNRLLLGEDLIPLVSRDEVVGVAILQMGYPNGVGHECAYVATEPDGWLARWLVERVHLTERADLEPWLDEMRRKNVKKA